LAQRGEARPLQVIALELQVLKGMRRSSGWTMCRQLFPDAADIEAVGVDELHAEDVFVGDVVGYEDFREAAEKVAQPAGSATQVAGRPEFRRRFEADRVAAETQMNGKTRGGKMD